LFGGFAPLIVTSMIAATGNKLAPSFYVIATGLISIAAALPLAHRMAVASSRFLSESEVAAPTASAAPRR
jgi:MFS transporter, MHS family, proline/betaine transporter